MANNRKGNLNTQKQFSSGIPFPEVQLYVTTAKEVEDAKAARKQAKETKQHTHNYFKNKAAEVKHWLETHKNIRKFQRFLLNVGTREKGEDTKLALAEKRAEMADQLITEAATKETELIALRFEQRRQAIASRRAQLQETKQLTSSK